LKPVLVLYATREGQTRHVALHAGESIRERGLPVLVNNVKGLPRCFTLADYSAVVVAASVHVGKHEAEMVKFVKRNVAELAKLPSLFLSVSLSQAGAEDKNATPEHRAEGAANAAQMIEKFLKDTGWHPNSAYAVAGALRYTRYNPIVRFMMRGTARRAGAPTDTSRDWEFTDWVALDRVVGGFDVGGTRAPVAQHA
jgi:menaquinone-dependent protoporphyrinogen oxidase